jgi:hypothetical protein
MIAFRRGKFPGGKARNVLNSLSKPFMSIPKASLKESFALLLFSFL